MIYLAPPKSKVETNNYLKWLAKSGLEVKVLASVDELEGFLVLAGGADIGNNKKRDDFEIALIEKALKNDYPILGICRGMQLVNHYMGGIVENLLVESDHCSSSDFIIEKKVGNKPSIFHDIIDEDGHEYQVNSRHHQYCANVVKPLRPVAWSEDGIIEAAKAKRILLVQWHPERKEIWGTIASDWPMFWLTSFFEGE